MKNETKPMTYDAVLLEVQAASLDVDREETAIWAVRWAARRGMKENRGMTRDQRVAARIATLTPEAMEKSLVWNGARRPEGTSYYRAEFMGAHHERKAGARPYAWAAAYRLTNGETHFPRFSRYAQVLRDALPRKGASWSRYRKGIKERVTVADSAVVPVTIRTVKARTPEQVAAAKQGGERRRARNHMDSAACRITNTNWSYSTGHGHPEWDIKAADDAICRIIQCLRGLDVLGIGR